MLQEGHLNKNQSFASKLTPVVSRSLPHTLSNLLFPIVCLTTYSLGSSRKPGLIVAREGLSLWRSLSLPIMILSPLTNVPVYL